MFAVNGADATPEALVATVIVFVALLNVPDAPEAGAVKVTFAPSTGLLLASRTVTESGLANAVLMLALCGVVPALTAIVAGGPAVFLRKKFTVRSPDEAAVTEYST